MQFECVSYCLLKRNNIPSSRPDAPEHIHTRREMNIYSLKIYLGGTKTLLYFDIYIEKCLSNSFAFCTHEVSSVSDKICLVNKILKNFMSSRLSGLFHLYKRTTTMYS